MSIKEAFLTVCDNAKPARSQFVSLYANVPFFGGPEEGGWWGSDTVLVAYMGFDTEEGAQAAKEKVEKLAEELTADAKRQFGRQCLREMEWLEQRGLEADFLPEVDGEESYFVVVEETPGSLTRHGCRHYE